MLLLKHHAAAGRVSLYEGYFYFTGFASPSQGVEAGNDAEEEVASVACWETQDIRNRDQSFPTPRGQAKSQRASKLGRLYGDHQQAPSTWRWVRASARELNNHGRTNSCRQPATRTNRGGVNVRGRIGRARCTVSAKWAAQTHSHGFGPNRTRCLNRDNQ